MKMFHSLEEANADSCDESYVLARRAGFDTKQQEDNFLLCGKHGSDEAIAIYPNGSWEYKQGDNPPCSGAEPLSLKIFFKLGYEDYSKQMNNS